MTFFGGDADNCDVLRARGTGDGLYMNDVSADRPRRFLWFTTGSDHRNVELTNISTTDVGYQAVTFDGYVENVLIENSSFKRHASDVPGSHMIAFYPALSEGEVKSRNVTIRNNVVEGRPNTPHIKTAQGTVANGGSGDLIAVRGTDGFVVENNIIRHSGEVGITISSGAKNGVVRNNTISLTDTTGLVLGNPRNPAVVNVDAYNNELFDNSLDRADSHNPLPALSLWNITDSCVSNNSIHDNPQATGLWVWDGDLPPLQPASVFNMYVTQNTFSNNLLDFVQSSRPARDFETASSFGGTNWTSTFGSPDVDGDGFGAACTSESDDSNPCVPFTGATTCTGNPTTTTTTAPTTTTTTTAPTTTTTTTTVPTTTSTTTTSTTTTSTTTTTTTTAPTTTTTTTTPTTTTTVVGSELCNGLQATIVGTEGHDIIYGTNGRDIIAGLGGDDIIYGNNGSDLICGGTGDDEIRGGRNNDTIFGQDGDDLLKGGLNNDRMYGDDGADEMFGNSGTDFIDGGPGDDVIRGNGGNDNLDGGLGDDYLAGNLGADRLTGAEDDDTLLGGPQRDSVFGGTGFDACSGGAGRNTVRDCETGSSLVDPFDSQNDDGNDD